MKSFGLNGECKNFPHQDPVCSKIVGSGSLLNNIPSHYRVSVPLLILSHIAMLYFHVKICVSRQIHVKVFHSFCVNHLKGFNWFFQANLATPRVFIYLIFVQYEK